MQSEWGNLVVSQGSSELWVWSNVGRYIRSRRPTADLFADLRACRIRWRWRKKMKASLASATCLPESLTSAKIPQHSRHIGSARILACTEFAGCSLPNTRGSESFYHVDLSPFFHYFFCQYRLRLPFFLSFSFDTLWVLDSLIILSCFVGIKFFLYTSDKLLSAQFRFSNLCADDLICFAFPRAQTKNYDAFLRARNLARSLHFCNDSIYIAAAAAILSRSVYIPFHSVCGAVS